MRRLADGIYAFVSPDFSNLRYSYTVLISARAFAFLPRETPANTARDEACGLALCGTRPDAGDACGSGSRAVERGLDRG